MILPCLVSFVCRRTVRDFTDFAKRFRRVLPIRPCGRLPHTPPPLRKYQSSRGTRRKSYFRSCDSQACDRREIDFYLARVKKLGGNMPERHRGAPPSKIKHLQITWNDI